MLNTRHTSAAVLLCTLLLATLLSGCATPYKASVDNRTIKEMASDETITFKIKSAFAKEETLDYLDIDAASYMGNVYLTGEYDTLAQKQRFISLAQGVDGVKSVTTYLLPTGGGSCGTVDRVRMLTEVNKKLVEDEDIWSTNVDVKAVQCDIVLMGLVGSSSEIHKSVRHARSVEGVRNVKSYLKVLNR